MTTATLPVNAAYAGIAQRTDLRRVSLSSIYADTNENVRRGDAYGPERIKNLKANILQTRGIIVPLIVTPLDKAQIAEQDPDLANSPALNGKDWMLVGGFMRYTCLTELAGEDAAFGENVPVVVAPMGNDATAFKLVQMIENLHRTDLDPLEIAEGYRRLMDESDVALTQAQVADLMNVSPARVGNYLKLLDLPDEIQADLINGYLTFTHCLEIMRAPQGENYRNWFELAKMAKTMTIDRFRKKVEERHHLNTTEETATETNPDTGESQRVTVKSRKGKDLFEKYLPEFKRRRDAVKESDKGMASLWQARIDAINWVLCNDEAKLAEELKPWEDSLVAEKEKEKARTDASKTQERFINGLIKHVHEMFTEEPTDPNAARPTLAMCFASARKDLEAKVAEAEGNADVLREKFGFDFPGVEAFMQTFTGEYDKWNKERLKQEHVAKAKANWRKATKALQKKDIEASDKEQAERMLAQARKTIEGAGLKLNEFEEAEAKKMAEQAAAAKEKKKKQGGKKTKKKKAATA